MILSVVGPGENALAPMTVASTRFGPRRPSAVVDGIGTAGALVERTQYATFNEKTRSYALPSPRNPLILPPPHVGGVTREGDDDGAGFLSYGFLYLIIVARRPRGFARIWLLFLIWGG